MADKLVPTQTSRFATPEKCLRFCKYLSKCDLFFVKPVNGIANMAVKKKHFSSVKDSESGCTEGVCKRLPNWVFFVCV